MFYRDIVTRLEKLREVKGSDFGLSRTRALLNALGSPDGKLKIIHIAGTNGKGSVTEYISQILKAAGKKAGAFRTPAVYDYREQFCVDCAPLSYKTLKPVLSRAYELGLTLGATAFETETAAALSAFCSEGCEYAVVECGLGGLYDATNAIDKKILAVITSIALEHTAVLGGTIPEICRHKGGIIKDCPVVAAGNLCPEAREYFKEKGAVFAEEIENIDPRGKFTYRGEEYEISLYGTAQCYNAAIAIECALLLNIPQSAIRAGLKNANIRGRTERISKGGVTYVLDGSHNPQSFAPLAELLQREYGAKERTVIYGCLSDKDAENCVKALVNCCEHFFAVSPKSYRAMQKNAIYNASLKYFPAAKLFEDLPSALGAAAGEVVAVCGSFTLLKEAYKWIEKK